MNPLGGIYGAVIGARNSLYSTGFFRTSRLDSPVISIGNIRVGGAGKTPFTIALGELLKARGIKFDVLSRGYRRRTTGVQIVDAAGRAEDFGDEPLLIAKQLHVPVIVGASRYEAGKIAEEKFQSQMHLLDDGFQHRALARDFDIVLVDSSDLRGTLLPGGCLREPVSSLSRADVLAIPADENESEFGHFLKPLWRVRRKLTIPSQFPKRAIAFCGLARPDRFFADLRMHGVNPAATLAFRDHHRYTAYDIERLRGLAEQNGADGFITTQKDLMNLGSLAQKLEALSIPELRIEIDDADRQVSQMLETIAARRQRRS